VKRFGVFVVAALIGCSGDDPGAAGPLADVSALVVLQRAPRGDGVGDIFQYTSYEPGGKLVKLTPPTADGARTELCCTGFAGFEQADIQGYDVAFDARSIVFSAKLTSTENYGLFLLTLDASGNVVGEPAQIPTNPMHDYVYPIFAPEGRIVFVTNDLDEAGAKQHMDEYERGITTQLGSIKADGSDELLGPRNLSHRVYPSMLADGRVLFTQWDHLGDMNAGHLMLANPDFTNLREAFGKEGSGMTNSTLKAIEVEPGHLVAIATDRDRTIQAGKVIDIFLGRTIDGTWRQSEEYASATDLTPLVPSNRDPSSPTVGRYYDVYPTPSYADSGDYLIVTWADGPVEQETLSQAGLTPDFGVYLFNAKTGARLPLFNDSTKWDVLPRPLMPRAAPQVIAPSGSNGYSDDAFLIGSLDVHSSSIATIERGSVVKVRVIEGFSAEEGAPMDFGLTEHEGAAMLGEADVFGDGSWAALVPANVPIHLQPIDKFGMAVVSEPVWMSGRAGEARFCGGCHEDRASTMVINPGITQALAAGAPTNLDRPRADRRSDVFDRENVVGVPWDEALQPILNRCATCHDGDPTKAGNKSLTFYDPVSMTEQTFTFNLSGTPVNIEIGEAMISGYSASHLSLVGPMMAELVEAGITVTGDMPIYVEPTNARGSLLFETLNPPQLYPFDDTVRFRPDLPVHAVETLGADLTDDEYYLLILMTDAGGQFYSRENLPGY
jgi:hypothetical protein